MFAGIDTSSDWNFYHYFTGYGQVCSGMPAVAKVTNQSYLLRNDSLDCYNLLLADTLTLRLSLDYVIRLAQPTMFLGVTIYYLLFCGGESYETLTSTRIALIFYIDEDLLQGC